MRVGRLGLWSEKRHFRGSGLLCTSVQVTFMGSVAAAMVVLRERDLKHLVRERDLGL